MKKLVTNLSKFFKSNFTDLYSDESGQILIIILLVLVVGVSIVLSLSARSITDVRTTTSTEQSNRAYFAAEAGIERALQQIKDGGISGTVTIAGQGADIGNGAQYSGDIRTTGVDSKAFYFTGLKDTTIQANLRSDINNDATGLTAGASSGKVTVYWHSTNSPTAADTAALEVSILRKNTSTGSYAMDRYGCDPFNSTNGNGFTCSGSVAPGLQSSGGTCGTSGFNPDTSNGGTKNFCYKASFSLPTTASGDKALLMRIRPIYHGDAIAVEYSNSSGVQSLPQQGYTITSTGVGKDGSNRKLQVFRAFPSLPTVFDFVLYNGSSNALQKP